MTTVWAVMWASAKREDREVLMRIFSSKEKAVDYCEVKAKKHGLRCNPYTGRWRSSEQWYAIEKWAVDE